MASTSPPNQDTLVSIKINIEGNNRRFKLPLRDLGASTLPDKLRFLLSIPPSAEVLFERYSDSAATFVVLDSNNASVYKQLYRAAKAKLKLRLRVTVHLKEPATPKPATVEDEESSPVSPVEPVAAVSPTPDESTTTIACEAPLTVTYTESIAKPVSVAEIQRGFEDLLISNQGSRSVHSARASPPKPVDFSGCCSHSSSSIPSMFHHKENPRLNNCSSTEIPVSRGTAARDKWFSELATLSAERHNLRSDITAPPSATVSTFSVFCNNCHDAIPDAHYHCGTCEAGDFDLCQNCVDKGIVCESEDHWMIKRYVKNGNVITSTTETMAPKKKTPVEPVLVAECPTQDSGLQIATRTCNSCIQELSEENFVTCTSCPDYDLCISCHIGMEHGHHPNHAFEPAVEDTNLDLIAKTLLAPGRNVGHNAICDGCDKYIYGVRHKCLDCPDWDFCAACIANASFIHPRHRFVPIYEPLNDTTTSTSRSYTSKARHHGIYCDGPLCNSANVVQTYIKGDRYKCAVCHDTDFCASCEASPSNFHNRTHPLIKFKTPVRNVSVTTLGDHEDGQRMPVMGDRRGRTTSKATETTPSSANAATQVQTIADLQPTEPVKAEILEVEAEKVPEANVEEAKELPAAAVKEDLVAHFVRDTVTDGTILPPNSVFEQTWYMRNGGNTAWPAGCSVKFVGGDNMCSVDPDHPASVHELVSAAESTTWYSEVAPGQEVGFTVLLRTPKRAGSCISYWRLTGPDGNKFGHKLWCDVVVKEVEQEPKDKPKQAETEVEVERSQMIFPKLEKESPTTSVHEEAPAAPSEVADAEELEEFDDFGEDALEDDETEDGFMTDEEYDILDASDDEYLAEQVKASKK
jgi:next-to-BRCA1 protein 1